MYALYVCIYICMCSIKYLTGLTSVCMYRTMNTTEGVIFRYYKYDISAVDILWRGFIEEVTPLEVIHRRHAMYEPLNCMMIIYSFFGVISPIC